MALTLAGVHEPFPAVAASALRVVGGGHLDVEAVLHWKRPVEVYQHALRRISPTRGRRRARRRARDCHGAHAAGLTTGWAARLERHYSEVFTRADIVGDDLVDVATGLVALPRQ